MQSQTPFIEPGKERMAAAGHWLVGAVIRHADTLLRCSVAVASMAIFGALSLLTEVGGLVFFGLVPILVFEYTWHW